MDDEYGSESYQARIYYRGPLRWGGSPRTIRIDITRNEKLSLLGVRKPISHLYSDAALFDGAELSCYCLEEVMAEKVRALGGQRRFAVSRDLYDIGCLYHTGVDLVEVQNILPDKFLARGIALELTKIDSLENRKKEFQLDWDRRLSYLVQDGRGDFEQVWCDVMYVLTKVMDRRPN